MNEEGDIWGSWLLRELISKTPYCLSSLVYTALLLGSCDFAKKGRWEKGLSVFSYIIQ